MKKTVTLLFFITICFLCFAQDSRPNILLIAIDDLNDWVGAYDGHPQARTPNIDKFAEKAIVFRNASCPGPVCGPSRSSLLSGYRPATTGIYGNTNNMLNSELVQEQPTLPEYFSRNGYVTISSGKIFHKHGSGSATDHGQWAYDVWEKETGSGVIKPSSRYSRHEGIINGVKVESAAMEGKGVDLVWGVNQAPKEETKDYMTAKWFEQKLQEDYDKPFFMLAGLSKPHLPFVAPQEFYDQYGLDTLVVPEFRLDDLDDILDRYGKKKFSADADFQWIEEQGLHKEVVRAYLAASSYADDCVGVMLKALAASKYADNTIVMIWGDHGWHLGEKLKYRKASLWKESTQLPFIFHVPGMDKKQECFQNVNLLDIYPTLIDLCGLPQKELDGRSFKPVIVNPDIDWYPTITTKGQGSHSVMYRQWHYITYNDNGEELYNLENDPMEWTNLANIESEEIDSLKKHLRSFMPKINREEIPNNEVNITKEQRAASLNKAEEIGVFFNFQTPQHQFAANDIKTVLEESGHNVQFRDLSSLDENYIYRKIVIATDDNADVLRVLTAQGGNAASEAGAQGYSLRTTNSTGISYWIVGGDDNGAMYGALQLAEYFNFDGLGETYEETDSPHLKNRGVKFNIPLDVDCPTYFYNNGGTSHKEAIRHVWDSTFWFTWFDEMARHRYNVLSLWSPHPFTAMLNMEDDYPGIAIQGVKGYNQNGDAVQINNWSIDQKVAYWQRIMEYGRKRGFDTYFCTWNIFLSTAEGKHGLTDDPGNQETISYLRKCMVKFLETYPDLKGFGVTVGERMGELSDKGKEEWAWATYGMGMKDYAEVHPERDLVFIHRQHQGDLLDIMSYFKELSDMDNVRFDLSFKYSQAHAHTTLTPDRWDRTNMESALSSNNIMSWLTIRNDDWYFLHWADPQFVRDYINHFPEVDKYVNAFYIGADGWVFTRAFTNKNDYYKDQNALSIQKTWFMQKLWGRLAYNPSVSDDLLKKHLLIKYPEVSADDLFTAWTSASRAVQKANEQVTGDWDLDFHWWPEGWTSKDGFRTLQETLDAEPFKGSSLCDFRKTANGTCSGETSALVNAEEIESLSTEALSIIENLDAGSNTELMLNLKDIEAMAYLGLYNANKFRSAVYKLQGKNTDAFNAIRMACCNWLKYTSLMDEQYIGVDLQRNRDFDSWHHNDLAALNDYYSMGGSDTPDCNGSYPWISIVSPHQNASFVETDKVVLDVIADAGDLEIEKVELRSNGELTDTDSDFPYAFELSGLEAGTYILNVRVYDNVGSSEEHEISIVVYDPAEFNTVPWLEDFSLNDGTVEDQGPTSWSASRPEGVFHVSENVFVINEAGEEGVFRTAEIDISGGTVAIGLDVWGDGGLDATDYVKFYKIVDGGTKEFLGLVNGDQKTVKRINGEASGEKLVLRIEAMVSFRDEYYFFDNLSVSYKEKLNQSITFPELPVKTIGDDNFDPGASSSSGLPVNYSSSNTDVAAIAENRVHITGVGESLITASQDGNDTYNAAPVQSQVLTVEDDNFVLDLLKEIRLFPNPANTDVLLQVPVKYAFSLFDNRGVELLFASDIVGSYSIDLRKLSRGVYHVKIHTAQSCVLRKLIKY